MANNSHNHDTQEHISFLRSSILDMRKEQLDIRKRISIISFYANAGAILAIPTFFGNGQSLDILNSWIFLPLSIFILGMATSLYSLLSLCEHVRALGDQLSHFEGTEKYIKFMGESNSFNKISKTQTFIAIALFAIACMTIQIMFIYKHSYSHESCKNTVISEKKLKCH